MSNFKAGLLALMIPVALTAPAIAQQEGPMRGPAMIFAEIDADGDGLVTLEEVEGAAANRFATADADGDGFLSRDEMLAHGAARMSQGVDRMLERADADGDGQLSLAEMEEARGYRRGPNPVRMFQRFDADGSGDVTEAEFDEMITQMMERRGGHGDGHGRRWGRDDG